MTTIYFCSRVCKPSGWSAGRLGWPYLLTSGCCLSKGRSDVGSWAMCPSLCSRLIWSGLLWQGQEERKAEAQIWHIPFLLHLMTGAKNQCILSGPGNRFHFLMGRTVSPCHLQWLRYEVFLRLLCWSLGSSWWIMESDWIMRSLTSLMDEFTNGFLKLMPLLGDGESWSLVGENRALETCYWRVYCHCLFRSLCFMDATRWATSFSKLSDMMFSFNIHWFRLRSLHQWANNSPFSFKSFLMHLIITMKNQSWKMLLGLLLLFQLDILEYLFLSRNPIMDQ